MEQEVLTPHCIGTCAILRELSEYSDKSDYPTDLIIRIFLWEVNHTAVIQKKDADNTLYLMPQSLASSSSFFHKGSIPKISASTPFDICSRSISTDGLAYDFRGVFESAYPSITAIVSIGTPSRYHPLARDRLTKSQIWDFLRRTRATNMYQDGTELELISRILGHSSTETTRIYAVPSIDMMRAAMEKGNLSSDEKKLGLAMKQRWPGCVD